MEKYRSLIFQYLEQSRRSSKKRRAQLFGVGQRDSEMCECIYNESPTRSISINFQLSTEIVIWRNDDVCLRPKHFALSNSNKNPIWINTHAQYHRTIGEFEGSVHRV